MEHEIFVEFFFQVFVFASDVPPIPEIYHSSDCYKGGTTDTYTVAHRLNSSSSDLPRCGMCECYRSLCYGGNSPSKAYASSDGLLDAVILRFRML
jgi:hypothetical protein